MDVNNSIFLGENMDLRSFDEQLMEKQPEL